MPAPIELPIPVDQVEAEIRRLAQEESQAVFVLPHAKERMAQRDISIRQIIRVLRNGDLIQAPQWDTEVEKGWRCVFAGISAGIKVTVVAKLVKRQNQVCLVVTTY